MEFCQTLILICPMPLEEPELSEPELSEPFSIKEKLKGCDPAGLLQESLKPFGPEVSPECPRECPRKWGVSEGVSDGGCPRPKGPGLRSVQNFKVSRECPRSVKKVSGHSGDTLGTLFGHSGARSPKGPGDTPSDTPSDTPHFRGHSPAHSRDTSGLKGLRDSCSRPAGSQLKGDN